MIYTHVAAALIAAALAGFGTWQVQEWRYQAATSEALATLAGKVQQAEQAARKTEQTMVANRQQVEKRYVEEKRIADAAADAAADELDRLREQIAAGGGGAAPDPAAARGADAGARLEQELLGACAGSLVQLAREADALEAVVVGLQGYVKTVCLAGPVKP